MSRARSACITLDTDHPKIIGLGRSKYLAAPLSFLTQCSWATAKPPTSRARSCARRQRGAEARRPRGEQPPKAAGLPLHQKRGGFSIPLYPRSAGGYCASRWARATSKAYGGRRAPSHRNTARRAHYTSTPRHKTHPRRIVAPWARKCRSGLSFYTRAGRVVRELFLICIKIRRSRLRAQLLPLRRQAFYSTSPRHKGRGIALAWCRVLMSRAQQAGHMARP